MVVRVLSPEAARLLSETGLEGLSGDPRCFKTSKFRPPVRKHLKVLTLHHPNRILGDSHDQCKEIESRTSGPTGKGIGPSCWRDNTMKMSKKLLHAARNSSMENPSELIAQHAAGRGHFSSISPPPPTWILPPVFNPATCIHTMAMCLKKRVTSFRPEPDDSFMHYYTSQYHQLTKALPRLCAHCRFGSCDADRVWSDFCFRGDSDKGKTMRDLVLANRRSGCATRSPIVSAGNEAYFS